MLLEKVVVGWQGDPTEFGRRLNWEAVRKGLGRACKQLVVADGAPWIWNLVQFRWPGAEQLLDFYHASQHLWEIGRALHGEDEAAVEAWARPLRRELKRGRQRQVLKQITSLKPRRRGSASVVRREQQYFAGHAERMDYQKLQRRGWPIGSGSVESACRHRQCRFKRPGQFWSAEGMRNLGALTEARYNRHWEELWEAA